MELVLEWTPCVRPDEAPSFGGADTMGLLRHRLAMPHMKSHQKNKVGFWFITSTLYLMIRYMLFSSFIGTQGASNITFHAMSKRTSPQ